MVTTTMTITKTTINNGRDNRKKLSGENRVEFCHGNDGDNSEYDNDSNDDHDNNLNNDNEDYNNNKNKNNNNKGGNSGENRVNF